MIQFERDENMKPPTRDEILEGARVTSLPVFERYGVSSVSLLEEVFDRSVDLVTPKALKPQLAIGS